MIAIGADHGGYFLKEEIKKYLDERGIAYKDFGTFGEESVDYPAVAVPVARAVANGEYERGLQGNVKRACFAAARGSESPSRPIR